MIKRGKVLVIDDEPSIVELFTDYLNGQGFDVISAGGGEEGLDRLRLDSPDIVLLDMRMPELDGLETLRRIRKVNLRVPVLMVSGNDDIAAAKEAIALGAFDYTLKPVDFNYLCRALDKMLATVQPPGEPGLIQVAATTGSAHGLLYDLALEVFRTTRTLSASARDVDRAGARERGPEPGSARRRRRQGRDRARAQRDPVAPALRQGSRGHHRRDASRRSSPTWPRRDCSVGLS